MGLDIYFYQMKKDSQERVIYEEKRKAENELLMRYNELDDEQKESLKKLSSETYELGEKVRVEVLYFRKMNFLLPFFRFIENASEMDISKDDVELLISVCDELLGMERDVAVEFAKGHLPTEEGFFFGGTEYDDRYFANVKYVKDEFTKLLSTFDFSNYSLVMYCD